MSIHLRFGRLRRPVRLSARLRLIRRAKPAGTARPSAAQLSHSGHAGHPARLVIDADVVVVDVETTGWLADAAGITEIGAVRLSGGEPVAEFSALVNPGKPIPPDITRLTGITDDMVAGAPVIAEVLPRFLDFARGSVIVAHNAPFDLGFLTTACDDCRIPWPPSAVLDTAVLARLVLRPGEVTDHKLTTLAAHFGTTAAPHHRALADAKATAGVLASLLALVATGRPRTGIETATDRTTSLADRALAS
ncbi:MAG TPA: exonuclease domain-containing protein [Streptosporangiaceae bacterium]|nr:exonuclease domain-containing protein [Streptosporangiaceae bacterium]